MARFERISPGHGRKLYGITLAGATDDVGASINSSPATVEGGTWIETVIFSFGGADGSSPFWTTRLMKPVHFMGPPQAEALGGGNGIHNLLHRFAARSFPGVRVSFTTSLEAEMEVVLCRGHLW